jgi:hypothetical protein
LRISKWNCSGFGKSKLLRLNYHDITELLRALKFEELSGAVEV